MYQNISKDSARALARAFFKGDYNVVFPASIHAYRIALVVRNLCLLGTWRSEHRWMVQKSGNRSNQIVRHIIGSSSRKWLKQLYNGFLQTGPRSSTIVLTFNLQTCLYISKIVNSIRSIKW